jgi:hypothetical protein
VSVVQISFPGTSDRNAKNNSGGSITLQNSGNAPEFVQALSIELPARPPKGFWKGIPLNQSVPANSLLTIPITNYGSNFEPAYGAFIWNKSGHPSDALLSEWLRNEVSQCVLATLYLANDPIIGGIKSALTSGDSRAQLVEAPIVSAHIQAVSADNGVAQRFDVHDLVIVYRARSDPPCEENKWMNLD